MLGLQCGYCSVVVTLHVIRIFFSDIQYIGVAMYLHYTCITSVPKDGKISIFRYTPPYTSIHHELGFNYLCCNIIVTFQYFLNVLL